MFERAKQITVPATLLVATWLALVPAVHAAPAAVPATAEFNRDVRPILSDKCFACHGLDAKQRKAELRLDVAESATREHDGVRAIVPGDVGKSAAWARINSGDPDEVMPPPESHKTVTPAEKDILKRWIEQGAKFQQHWSFEPVRPTPPPTAAAPTRNAIDAFLFSRLEREGLKPAKEADRPTLVRRVAFALTGLPPTPAEVDRFANDPSPDAYEWMVDSYLASPRYGEEMARHWLDVARYADTHGLHLDNERQTWAYRDYVINSFNENKPFHRFTVEQLAGDLLPDASKPSPTKEQLVATGFNRNNVTTSEGGSIDAEFVFRYAVDRSSTVMTTWMGLTGGCAVCHDHKFDPISAKEFYSFYSFFHSAADPAMDGNALLTQPVVKLPNGEQEKRLEAFAAQITAKQKELDAKAATVAYIDPGAAPSTGAVAEHETVWVDDDFPRGATVPNAAGRAPKWVTAADGGAPVFSGARALKLADKGLSQEFFEGGVTLTIPAESRLFAYVYLDLTEMPKSVMLQYNKGGWNHRAVWGDYDAIEWGSKNGYEKVAMGSLPAAGQWVRLEFPADRVGLRAGDSITGLAVTQFGGTVYWDRVGVVGRSDPAADPSRSFLAWRKAAEGKDTPGVPGPVKEFLKAGPEKEISPEQLARLKSYYIQNVCAETKAQFAPVVAQLDAVRKQRDEFEKAVPATFVFNDMATPRESFIMLRGQYDKQGEKVEPATPAFLPPLKKAKADGRATRLDLARWLVAPEHPMTARVTVNRFWQQFFGTGLAKSSEDFGSQGQPPTHPELLDYLAADFQGGGWDVKRLVRQLITSAAFRQDPGVTPDLLARDPENRLYARGPRFRLDAEQVRDNVLFVSGLMNFETGGKGVNPYQPPNIWEPVGFVGSNTREYRQDHGPALYRRSVYTFLKRTAMQPFMANFDAPSREQSCTRRERSNTPLQALQLMNDVQHFEAARALAERMLTEGGTTPAERITFAYRAVLARKPEDVEVGIVSEELAKHFARYKSDEAAAKKTIGHGESKPKVELPPADLAAYTLIANMVLNLDETLNRN